jgi:cell wall-associated NlpC family hydrolase
MFTDSSQITPPRRLGRTLVLAFTGVALTLVLQLSPAGAIAATQHERPPTEASTAVQDATRQLWSALEQRRQADEAQRVEGYLTTVAAQAQTDRITTVLDAGRAKIGRPYRRGGAGPSVFDCSGFTRWAWQAAGVELPHYSGAQYAQTRHISMDELQPGDLVFYWGRGGGDPSHVALYVGDGQILHAPGTGRSVRYDSVWYWSGAKVAAGRVG